MENTADILRLRILLILWNSVSGECSVTKAARTLGEEKYAISRIMASLEKEGFLDRSSPRHPILTEAGKKEAKYYAERVEISMNHLIYEGVEPGIAKQDALRWALYCTDQTMEVVRATEERYRVKYELRGEKEFDGEYLCRKFKNGNYKYPFLIYREHAEGENVLSMGNEGFEHPCTLAVKNGVGTVQISAVPVERKSAYTGELMQGKVQNMCYFDGKEFCGVEMNGNLISFPAAALHFVNVGSGVGQILHGTVCIKMGCSVGNMHMPESRAMFTMLI